MKNIAAYYAAILLPLLGLILSSIYGSINPTLFLIGILLYALLYHPAISGLRLVQLKQIPKSEFKNNFIPGWNLKYFKSLFLGVNTSQQS